MINRVERERELAKKLVNYSCHINPKEKVLITYSDTPATFIEILIEEISKAVMAAIKSRGFLD